MTTILYTPTYHRKRALCSHWASMWRDARNKARLHQGQPLETFFRRLARGRLALAIANRDEANGCVIPVERQDHD